MNHAAIHALDATLRSLVADEQKALVRFLRHLEVLDREQAYAALNCGSTFEYLVRELHLPEGTAWARVNALRLIRRFPLLEAALDDGRLNPTQLVILGPILTPENVHDLVARATHLTKAKTKELAVSIQPKEVPADGLRRLPTPAARPAAVTGADRGDAPEVTQPVMALQGTQPAPPALAPPPPPARQLARSSIEPVAADRWQWRIGLTAERKAKLDRLRGLLGHKVPDGDWEKVFDQMLDDSRTAARGRQGGSRRPTPVPGRSASRSRGGWPAPSQLGRGQRCLCPDCPPERGNAHGWEWMLVKTLR